MRVYIGNTGHIKKSQKIQNFMLVLGIQKTDFYDFSRVFYKKKSGIRESRVRRRFRESRVRRRCLGISSETAAPCYHVVADFPFYGVF